ncbi:extensin-like domain-containing protein [Ollibium composti]|uniref:Extensin family protein n=1 Tax=Ollibium composti TaxID=2675109 RepID=A0ABY2Q4H6_9HYPH|nr:extensin family protein [Mesorhizobium composti]THF56027.1 extensin family protein [Mesorhizobium composti]
MREIRFATIAVLAFAALTWSGGQPWAKTPKLPPTAPLPAPSEAAPAKPQTPAAPPAEAPVPAPRPAEAPGTDKAEPPTVAPAPPEKPELPPDAQDKAAEPEKPKLKPDPRSDETAADTLPAGEIACRMRLQALGVAFENRKAEHDAAIGCSMPYPVAVKKLDTAGLSPDAEMNCAMAEAAARFLADVVEPAARVELGSGLKSVEQASAFVCRPRHNGQKLSEHAFGNALDISAFVLDDGTRIEIGPAPPEKQAKFLARVRQAACGPFKTVLGPGSDADHARHFHLDLEPRRNGGTFCQ